ncbi:permease [Mucilaginibacter sp. L3T2-6]|uniref:permease n=1 Tax=Mucilaginibacter sp. L3T2-6 TaxID=3062491 RepID=UPI002676878A|nr:permease [Mucilaginibacter sp. L3T2-6]MDO3643714.1 permease [Mucilaginibacter sp. L3T2-6]MDV6216165.1 permease [Mucilaginibacter sp. L3T2-6]
MISIILKILSGLFFMIWDIYWGLAFGFILSSLVRAFASTEKISSKLGKDTVASTALSTFFGAVSSSCSYAAASMARTLLIKGATWSNAVSFMVASTNLVFEIFIVIVSLLGWSFFGGEVIGGLFFIIVSAILINRFFPPKVKDEAKENIRHNEHSGHDHSHEHQPAATKSCCHSMPQKEVAKPGILERLKTASGHFYMDVTMVGKDIAIGLVIASILMVLVPDSFWQGLFLTGHTSMPHFLVLSWNAIVGIFIAVIAFVCSVGNIVMAAVLWQGGISFGGVIAFILSDLVTVPMLLVFKSYYGGKTMWYLLVFLVISIFLTSLFLDYSFAALHWLPKSNSSGMQMGAQHFVWNYNTWLNLIFIPVSLWYFFLGRKSMKM